jgi:DNA-3-methyladenine glycosylase II
MFFSVVPKPVKKGTAAVTDLRRGNTVMFGEKIAIQAVPPFSFDLSAEIFSNGDKQIRNYEKGKFRQVIRVDGKLILITVESTGTVDEPELFVELRSDKKISEQDKKETKEAVNALFNLDFDLAPFYAEVNDDKIMAYVAWKLRGLKSPTTPTVFEALTDSIVEQQISLKVANSLEKKLIKKFGDTLDVDGEAYYAYPTPQRLASTSVEELRRCGLSLRKAEYIKAVSALVAEGKLDLEKLKNYADADAIIRELDEIRGIGVWTAELTLIRGMQKWEAMPADDLGLRRVISHYYCGGKRITSAQARQIAKGWGKWKGLAAYYLVAAEMLGTEA